MSHARYLRDSYTHTYTNGMIGKPPYLRHGRSADARASGVSFRIRRRGVMLVRVNTLILSDCNIVGVRSAVAATVWSGGGRAPFQTWETMRVRGYDSRTLVTSQFRMQRCRSHIVSEMCWLPPEDSTRHEQLSVGGAPEGRLGAQPRLFGIVRSGICSHSGR